MTTTFPAEFVTEINQLLGKDANRFWAELKNGEARAGLRLNTLRAGAERVLGYFPAVTSPLPWAPEGFELPRGWITGLHGFQAAGLVYLQEPSAMVPVAALDPRPGELVLDLCAAPGGKTTQILSAMDGRGIVVANDPNPRRVKALELNLGRWGARNGLVTCETPQRLADHFGPIFDRVLVDAPCSGEGTFRSHPSEIQQWSLNFSARCAALQDEILWFAAKLVRPGGLLVYSTCTFNQLENEGSLNRFLDLHPDFSLEPIPATAGFAPGLSPPGSRHDFSRAVRIWPHLAPGEGHFAALLSKSHLKTGEENPARSAGARPDRSGIAPYQDFFEATLIKTPRTQDLLPENPSLQVFGNRLYLVPDGSPILEGLRVQDWGWWIGTVQNDRFTPSPALAAGITGEDVQKVLEFSLDDPGLESYLRGSPVAHSPADPAQKGWVLVTVAGFSLGWGKQLKGKIKSHIPSWLRSN